MLELGRETACNRSSVTARMMLVLVLCLYLFLIIYSFCFCLLIMVRVRSFDYNKKCIQIIEHVHTSLLKHMNPIITTDEIKVRK